jgi:hypothetical protein
MASHSIYAECQLPEPDRMIRLLEVEYFDRESRPCFKLRSYRLDSAPEFSALSRMWWGQDQENSIVINAQPTTVLLNLRNFLTINRVSPQGELLWIDALCIDQKSQNEKKAQVPLMGRIYSLVSTDSKIVYMYTQY